MTLLAQTDNRNTKFSSLISQLVSLMTWSTGALEPGSSLTAGHLKSCTIQSCVQHPCADGREWRRCLLDSRDVSRQYVHFRGCSQSKQAAKFTSSNTVGLSIEWQFMAVSWSHSILYNTCPMLDKWLWLVGGYKAKWKLVVVIGFLFFFFLPNW